MKEAIVILAIIVGGLILALGLVGHNHYVAEAERTGWRQGREEGFQAGRYKGEMETKYLFETQAVANGFGEFYIKEPFRPQFRWRAYRTAEEEAKP